MGNLGKHVTALNVGRDDCVSADEPMDHIDADAVLGSVVAGSVLLDPTGVKVLLEQGVWLVCPSRQQLACVMASSSALVFLCYHSAERGINDLSTRGLQPLGS